MKITRHKKVHKYLGFFCNNYGFRQPYQILIDGTFCYAALKNKFNIKEQLPKYLDGEVKLLTTQCVIIETEKLGSDVFGALLIVKQFAVHKCGHEGKPEPASRCLESMLGSKNSSRYIIASQDRELQDLARRIPGSPILYLHQKTPTLEQPSETSVRMARLNSQAKFNLSKLEEKSLTELKVKKLGDMGTEPKKKKFKKKGGPNPLSCKKKKKKPDPLQGTEQGKSSKRRRRKRIKISKHIKEHLLAQAKS
ncbi:rRNA-processing protein UTP23 homolog [Anabrus simplex]|uniref:rRNA-processing protein UTP23 homolog n=1 Tax=Anabrus simplex TaxID=316456 RepID=UPI0035A2B63C